MLVFRARTSPLAYRGSKKLSTLRQTSRHPHPCIWSLILRRIGRWRRTCSKNWCLHRCTPSLLLSTSSPIQWHSSAKSRRSSLVFSHQRKSYVCTRSAQRASSLWLQKVYSVAKIEDPEVMDKATHKPKLGGLMDPRMGTIDRNFKRQTCGEGMSECHKIRMVYFSFRCVHSYLLSIHPASHTPCSIVKGSNVYV